jgi:ATP phosphoribosyltransferase regulatory subunit HisZ
MFEKPLGMRDTLPELYEKKHRVRSLMEDSIKQWGYQFIDTPPPYLIKSYSNYSIKTGIPLCLGQI